MKVIVTGGEGFIGKAFTAYLRKHEVDVCVVDRVVGVEAETFFFDSRYF